MDKKIKVLGIAGSLRKGSYNKGLMRAAVEVAPENMEIEVYDIKDIPLYNQDMEANMPEVIKEFKKKIVESDAILIATPEYNYSIPGVLKNALDWGSRPYGNDSWEGKPVAIMGATPSGFGTMRSQNHLRGAFVFFNMHPINHPEVYISFANKKCDENGNLHDDESKEKIKGREFWLYLSKV